MKISVAAVLLALGATQALATDMSKLMQDAQAQVMMTPMTTLAEPLVSRYDDLNMHFSKNAALPTVEELAGSDMKVFSAYLFEFGPGENTPVQVTVAFLRMEREPAGSEYEGGLDPKKVEVFVMHSDVKTHADAKKALKTGKNVLAYKTAEPNNKYKYYFTYLEFFILHFYFHICNE